ncbi:MAG: (Fe-S)-binding protein [Chloroflexi bacterium]|nr:MAG: (Fe-S)-binding protein [Chloroflexota bacterium]TMG48882.1 MAG: (Fe-S)-binding protein [Chloroflexota bacterium]
MLGDEADSPRGRIQLIRTVVASPAAPSDTTVEHLEACLVCRACETACPSGVPFGRIMEGAREVLRERDGGGAFARTALETVARPRRLALAARLADIGARLGLARLAARLPGRVGWASSLAAPAEGTPFRGVDRESADVSVFAGCIMRESFGDTERATVRLLERDGHVVSVPEEQTCCGALHAHAGDGKRARELARLNIDAFSGSEGKVVVNAAGCGAHLKDYGHVLAGDPFWADRAKAFAARVRDISEVAKPVPARTRRAIRVVYQDACHLAHGQRIRAQPRALLRAIEGVILVDIDDAERCCGSAGIYNLTHPEISRQLQQDKVQKILEVSPDVIVSANPGCMLQIGAGLRAAGSNARVVHLARFLDDPDGAVAGDP